MTHTEILNYLNSTIENADISYMYMDGDKYSDYYYFQMSDDTYAKLIQDKTLQCKLFVDCGWKIVKISKTNKPVPKDIIDHIVEGDKNALAIFDLTIGGIIEDFTS